MLENYPCLVHQLFRTLRDQRHCGRVVKSHRFFHLFLHMSRVFLSQLSYSHTEQTKKFEIRDTISTSSIGVPAARVILTRFLLFLSACDRPTDRNKKPQICILVRYYYYRLSPPTSRSLPCLIVSPLMTNVVAVRKKTRAARRRQKLQMTHVIHLGPRRIFGIEMLPGASFAYAIVVDTPIRSPLE